MNSIPISSLFDGLRHGSLLAPEQLKEAVRMAAAMPTAQAVAEELAHRGWLTSYQASELSAGRGFGLVFGPYVLLDKLGEGGMGEVFRARHRLLAREAAVKRMLPHLVKRPDLVERFLREGRAAAKLSHPNVVRIHDVGDVDGAYYLAMEYLHGTTLAHLLEQRGPLPVAMAIEYVRQACLGMQHAHERGMIHRDLKPANLLLTEQRKVVILDMGLARLTTDGPLTHTGEFFGTCEYAAPEQLADARHVDVRADVYSLGCVLYHLVTGRVPLSFKGVPWQERLELHRNSVPLPLSEFLEGIPPRVEAVVLKLMAKAPEERFQTPGEAAQALGALVRRRAVARHEGDPKVAEAAGKGPPADPSSTPPTAPFAASTAPAVEVQIAVPGQLCVRPTATDDWTTVGETPGQFRIDRRLEYRLKIDDRVNDDRLQGLAELGWANALQALDLSCCKRVTDVGLALLSSLPSLHALNLDKCPQVTDAGLERLRALRELQTLTLRGCERVTDVGLAHLGALQSLEALSLGDSLWGCETVTDEGLAHLRALGSLRVLNLRGCDQVTDAGLAHLRSLPGLQKLNLSNCKRVTDEGLAHLAALGSLRKLDLSGCELLTDDGMRRLRRLPSLQVLRLEHCKRVTDAGLRSLLPPGCLKKLSLVGCDLVTDEGLRALMEAAPHCAIKR